MTDTPLVANTYCELRWSTSNAVILCGPTVKRGPAIVSQLPWFWKALATSHLTRGPVFDGGLVCADAVPRAKGASRQASESSAAARSRNDLSARVNESLLSRS